MRKLKNAFNIDDLERLAIRRLPKGLVEFISRGAEDEVTLEANRQSIKQVHFRQRVGVDVSACDPGTTIFGVRQALPIAIGVTGLSGIFHYKGEQALAQAAADANIPYTVGSHNFTPLAELKEICGDLLWRQLYPPRSDDLLDHHIRVTRDAGVRVLVITMDSPVGGNREYMLRNGFMPGFTNVRTYFDALTAPHWLLGTWLRYKLSRGLLRIGDMPEGQQSFFGTMSPALMPAANFTWDNVRDLRRRWPHILVVKGISTAEDAELAIACGVDGIIVSNHGGRSLDGCVASMAALPAIVDAAGSRATVMIDGGFRRGADIVKAIAMGAASVMVGRATLYGLAAGGQPGAARAIAILQSEIDRTLALTGCPTLGALSRDMLIY